MSSEYRRVDLAGIVVDLLQRQDAVARIIDHSTSGRSAGQDRTRPLSVVSANLDHVVQFGAGGRWHGVLGDSLRPTQPLRLLQANAPSGDRTPDMEWLTLLDGAPLVAQSNRLTGGSWPRLAGSDLIGPILNEAERTGLSVGFLGGSAEIHDELSRTLAEHRPRLQVSGFWAPARTELEDHDASVALANAIHRTDTDILVVGLGKPRQELWMAAYGTLTGAQTLLAFGAVVDFLAGAVRRAPTWVSDRGLEWAWRLAAEPRRMARRYLVDDPPGLLKIRRDSSVLADDEPVIDSVQPQVETIRSHAPLASFVGRHDSADVTVLVVTYNNEDTIDDLMLSLRREALTLALRVVVADNGSVDGTLERLQAHPDVIAVSTESNLGYAGGINAVRFLAGDCSAVLVLNPDLTVGTGAIAAMLERLVISGAGIVVPRLLQGDGKTYPSLRREPSLGRALGDALLGERLPQRPVWTSEMEFNPECYAHPHQVDWATGAALLIDAGLDRRLGVWDEQFFLYSEETDYFRRARESGATIWYEPEAVMTHHMGGSGASVALNALMAANRVRYVRKHRSARYASAFKSVVVLHEALRSARPGHRGIFSLVSNEQRWSELPRATQEPGCTFGFPPGAVIIPAHNESSVIARTLAPLAGLAASGAIEVIVACNGCTDDTAEIARGFAGVRVLESQIPSKVAALNLADGETTVYPRLYLDADIVITPSALRMTFDYLSRPGALSARPAFEYVTAGASWPVRAFYRARRRLPATNEALWGAGAYGMSEIGRRRFDSFPDVTADDLYVDLQFSVEEKQILPTPPVQVSTPRSVASLMSVLRRNYRGQDELRSGAGAMAEKHAPDSLRTLEQLLASVSGPFTAVDAGIYGVLAIGGRLKARNASRMQDQRWERDESSR
ncbi:WecB/TagA/CpsF family glycosyltransferase [Paeniglutamicibacter sp. ABSL32-1]|uniref:WecB/TagA/CpsF family glycosyltransferase n=1 Tax=Paeniglutamicibacter quisquiliarum TaxID=2849498 RepID=UPI001C2DD736|nr:WecB/TagA/CpsF family glycosyltransferase [Paeniglutamicibacter quisquiliarum]MBV1779212.1 WecB/TagA/CpsF family glycosyltransferase [Paeniglutamicibacter quisquiliarum]